MALIIDGIMTGKLPWGAGAPRGLHRGRDATGRRAGPGVRGGRVPAAVDLGADLRRRPGAARSSTGSSGPRAEESDSSPAVLLSSGYIAGGAIAGILFASWRRSRSAARTSASTWRPSRPGSADEGRPMAVRAGTTRPPGDVAALSSAIGSASPSRSCWPVDSRSAATQVEPARRSGVRTDRRILGGTSARPR